MERTSFGRRLLPAAVLLLALVGCGGGGDDSGVASLNGGGSASAGAGIDPEQQALKLAACLREHGVPNFPDPTVDGEGKVSFRRPQGVPLSTLRRAAQDCRQYTAGLDLGLDTGDRTELADALVKYAGCMRENGYDLPDPDLSGANGLPPSGGPFGGRIDEDDPTFIAANQKCKQYISQLPGVGGTS